MISKIKVFLRIVVTVKNWPTVLMRYFFPKENFFCKFRNGHKISIKKWDEFMNQVNFFRIFPEGEIEKEKIKIKYGSNPLVFNCGNIGPCALGEVFGVEIYKKDVDEFNINGKKVVDIGASFGDTAIYFAIKGAEKIYAFEPLPSAYKLAEENIRLNNFQNKCQIINAAVGWGKGAYSEDPKFKYIFYRDLPEYSENKEIPIISLRDIVDKFDINGGVLKIDCEGREYDIILNSPDELLRKFDYIVMEYHYGFEKLKDKLESAGFSVVCGKPNKIYAEDRQDNLKNMEVGYIRAIKVF